MSVHVVSAAQASARDQAAIAAGIHSMQLMRSAGTGAARLILERFSNARDLGVLVYCGPGNNGGDGWVVAGELARAGVSTRVIEIAPPRSHDATTARREALPHLSLGGQHPAPRLIVDALLGTGAEGELREPITSAAADIALHRASGARVVALDVPTGVDATTGEIAWGAVKSDLTLTFGSAKRGLLLCRSQAGEIIVLDIGLGEHANLSDGAPRLVDAVWVAAHLPTIAADAHKGTRRRVLMVGGDEGMAGAIILAARAALRSGVGMVKTCVHQASVVPLQVAVPEATAIAWPIDAAHIEPSLAEWPHALLMGPGLGAPAPARRYVTDWLNTWSGPVVLDADALNAFAGHEESLGDLLDGRPTIVTPHPLEFARLIGVDVDTVLAERFEIGARLARALHAVVVLKGVPTVVTAPDGRSLVTASGNAALAAAGSGDVLSGMAVTLLAQSGDPLAAAACAAWVHGRAAERATKGRTVRGVTLEDILGAMGTSWGVDTAVEDGVLAALPAPEGA